MSEPLWPGLTPAGEVLGDATVAVVVRPSIRQVTKAWGGTELGLEQLVRQSFLCTLQMIQNGL